jgi:chorismate synthase
MAELRFLTAGESHGQALVGILEGMPAGIKLDREKLDLDMTRRQAGLGRGGRMKIERDRVEIVSGIRFGVTLGSPIAVWIENKDWPNWRDRMNPWTGEDPNPVTIPRPGHADLAGAMKYGHKDIRNVLERASARETAVRVALGSIVRQFLESFGIWIGGHVIRIHEAAAGRTFEDLMELPPEESVSQIRAMCDKADASPLRCADPDAERAMAQTVEDAAAAGNTVGGAFELAALGVPVGLGSHVSHDRKLDARLAFELMSIPAVKAVEIGLGARCAERYGSEVHDPIRPSKTGIGRTSNRAGGIEGGISNGSPVLARASVKPIPTLVQALPSVDLATGLPASAHRERSDVCAVPATGVVGEAMLALGLGRAFMESYGGDSMDEIHRRFDARPR